MTTLKSARRILSATVLFGGFVASSACADKRKPTGSPRAGQQTAANAASANANPAGSPNADPEFSILTITVVDIDTKLAVMCGIAESDVFFKFDSAKLLPAAKDRLDRITSCATTGPAKGKDLRIIGRSDPVGSDAYNKQLGMSRAESVAKYLQDQGVKEARTETESEGEAAAPANPWYWPLERSVTVRLKPNPNGEMAEKNLPDTQINSAVQRQLSRDPAVNATAIQVKTTQGIVELTGTVNNVLAQERALRHAEVVKGVRAVSNRIKVKAPAVADDALARNVQTALLFDPAADSYEIASTARAGVVTLKGTVQSWQEMKIAERVASGVKGVSEVKNEINVKYKRDRSDGEIARDIEGRMRWDVLVDNGLINVAVIDGKVRLSGSVGSAAEKSRAYWDAWVAGTKNVDNSGLEVRWWASRDDLRKDKYVVKSPKEIEQAIQDAAMNDPRVFSFNIQAAVTGSVATLKGTVDNQKAKRAAEQLAKQTVGVTGVKNELKVKPTKPISDVELQKRIAAALLWNPYTESFDVNAKVNQGKVVLTGTVDSFFEKAEADDVASGVRGVLSVENKLAVKRPQAAFLMYPYIYPYYPYPYAWSWSTVPAKPTEPDKEIAKNIESEMFWSPFVSENEVHVAVMNGKATLTGTVDSWRERDAATDNAFEGGAVAVANKLKVD